MLAQEMAVVFTKHAEQITPACWSEFLRQLEEKGLYLVIETDTVGRMMSPLGGFMPLPSKDETLLLLTAEELNQRGLPLGHHIVNKREQKNISTR